MRLHSYPSPPPQIVQVEVAFLLGEDAFDALPLPLQPPVKLRAPFDDWVKPQPLRQGFRFPVWERYHGGGAKPVSLKMVLS